MTNSKSTGLTTALNIGLGIISLFAAYKVTQLAASGYKKVDSAIDSVIDPIADAYFEWSLGDGVELSEFNVGRLRREQFNEQFQMLPEVFSVYLKAYPQEITAILDENNVLLEQYRNQIGE